MKNIFLASCMLLFSLNVSSAKNETLTPSEENLAIDGLFCPAGWADVEEYWDAGGSDGFYAGYLFCYHCGC
ncbi:hypothetical protein [Muricauda brasiliensis]|uniref:hypothetical protein n=1 Tax=Muricauda brasiliensis TaxID=2162892 RepID=UPI000D39ABEB|nr:hypothetical protein [Muricauda brasiliensis]